MSDSSFLKKEKLKSKILGVLRPYKISFLDLGKILDEIKSYDLNKNSSLREKYGDVNIDNIKSSNGFKYFTTLIIVIVLFSIGFAFFFNKGGEKGPAACDCLEQFNYWHQEGGMYKIDQDKMNICVDKFKDENANDYPEDFNSAEKNAKSKCND
jgi:hypothetical protein